MISEPGFGRPRDKYLEAVGRRLLGEANDLKRTPELLARELEIPLEIVLAVLEGSESANVARDLILRMADKYPISLGSIWVERDETDEGVIIMRAGDSRASARTLERRLANGLVVPYYEYLDTAMCRTAPFKPEFIRQLQFVTDADPDNQNVAMNNGHLMHQFSFYLGDVNAYWSSGGRRYCSQLSAGDSTYMAPFIPHSFTSRNKQKPGFIVAVTYAGPVRFALDEFAQLSPDDASELAGDIRESGQTFRARLRRQLMSESLTVSKFIERVANQGISGWRIREILENGDPTIHEISCLADCLQIRTQDLLADTGHAGEVVVVHRADERITRTFPDDADKPDYVLFELARTKYQPLLRAFEFNLMREVPVLVNGICHSLHEYVYNHSAASAVLHWSRGRTMTIAPGDSAYIAPMRPHAFTRAEASAETRLLVVRIPGSITDAALDEFAGFDPSQRRRACGESVRWY